jgi:hypothetical protein
MILILLSPIACQNVVPPCSKYKWVIGGEVATAVSGRSCVKVLLQSGHRDTMDFCVEREPKCGGGRMEYHDGVYGRVGGSKIHSFLFRTMSVEFYLICQKALKIVDG